jgi:hypothetical protein
MKQLLSALSAILALSIYDVPGKVHTYKVVAETESGKYVLDIKAKNLEDKEEEIYRWLRSLEK